MMQLRQHIGEVVNDVLYTNTSYVIEKHGKPICSIQPYNAPLPNTTAPESDRVRRIDRLFGSIKKKSNAEPNDWTAHYNQVDEAYERKMKKISQ